MIEQQYGGQGALGYEIKIEPTADHRFSVSCATLPELSVSARTREEAHRCADAELEQAIKMRMARNESIPDFDRTPVAPYTHQIYATLRALHVLKVQFYAALRDRGMTRADLMRQLGWHRNQVDRLFDLDHASRLDQIREAADALGLQLDSRLTINVVDRGVQVTRDGDGWRVSLVREDPLFAGDVLTPEALPTEEEAERVAGAVRRALDLGSW